MNTRFINSVLQNKGKLVIGVAGLCLGLGYAASRKYFAHQKLSYALQSYAETKLEQKTISYSSWQKSLLHEPLPAAVINLDAFDRNVQRLSDLAEKDGKPIRLATKSIRVPDLIKRALKQSKNFQGVMCYSAEEAYDLFYEEKIDDILIAYPTTQTHDLDKLRRMHASGAKISLVVDDIEHMQQLSEAMKGLEKPFSVLIEMDMPLQYLGGRIQLGVRRSPVRSPVDLKNLLEKSRKIPNIKVIGVMAYEAIVAGLPDKNSPQFLRDPIAQIIRHDAATQIAQMRAEVPKVFAEVGMKLEIFNGGGTGSINLASKEKVLTEMTAGSALLCSHLFDDRYSNLGRYFEPAVYFATLIVRSSDPNPNLSSNYPIITCSGGGIIGSGSIGKDKLPMPVAPAGLELMGDEGAGEVQTPLVVRGNTIPKIGQFVMWRPAKSGEALERFNNVTLISNEEKVGRAPTYRGKGRCYV